MCSFSAKFWPRFWGREGQWPVTLCGWTEEIAGDWWSGFVAGNGRAHLEKLTTHWVPVECISGFSSHTPSSCTN